MLIPSRVKKTISLICLITVGLLTASCSNGTIENTGPSAAVESTLETAMGAVQQSPEEKDEAFEPYLLASLPDRRISLFAEENGVTLQTGDLKRQYEWNYMTPRGIVPRLHVRDYDGDGADELAVILYMGSGTGVSVEELHLIKLDDLRDYALQENEYRPQIEQAIADLKTSSAIPQRYADETLLFGNWVAYDANESGLRTTIGIGIAGKESPMSVYIGELIADVNYKDGAFTLSGFRFEKAKQEAETVQPS
ncbi:hypothetical protein [Cohnella terricola]|uniref:Lipoprotein n=1 Tax=Cohnella terricola TaxID=1289167 RepID=A0A559J7V2_9BACL|nr:hypothetical protein [Cohnella terricola]TVX95970.1 hypothetical protein FPZ45_22390 [Cohnella terricola]